MASQFIYKDQTYSVGDRVLVHQSITEEDKTRSQVFDGLIIAIKGRQPNTTFTVRKIAINNVGVERIIPINSPLLEKIELKSRGRVKRSKLYYLRQRVGRSALRVKEAKEKNESTKSKTSKRSSGRKTSPKTPSK